MAGTDSLAGSECLSVRGGRLFVEDCDAVALAERFGTPLFVMSEGQLRSNARRFREAFELSWPAGPVDVLPAFKANWTLATRHVLNDEGCGADVYSAGELHGALLAGVDPERISVNGGGKSEALVRECVRAGVRITIEDLDEPELVDRVAGELGVKAKVRFRVKPDFPALWRRTDFAPEHASIDLGIQIYKSGIPAQYLAELGRRTLALDHVELVGLHLHVGRHDPSLWYWRRTMKAYAKLIADLARAWGDAYRPLEIDIGGGFASPRDPHNKLGVRQDVMLSFASYPFELFLRVLGRRLRYAILSRLFRVFGKAPSRRLAPAIEDYAEAAGGTLRTELERRGVPIAGVRLQVEPGRSLYGNAGIHLTRVKKVKEQTAPVRFKWILTDTTCFFLTNGVVEMNFHDFRVANKPTAPAVEIADIVGHSCAGDRILPFAKVPHIEEGDVLALLDTGAYDEGSASNFNALPRPATVLVRGDQAEVIRRAETLEDLYRRDLVPERLAKGRDVGARDRVTRLLAVAHLIGAAGIGLFWAGFYSGVSFSRDALADKIPNFEAFYAFEKAFTLPDLVTATGMTVAGVRLLTRPRSRWGATLLVAASGALVFLGMLDVTYDLKSGMYSLGHSFSLQLLTVPLIGVVGLATIVVFIARGSDEGAASAPL